MPHETAATPQDRPTEPIYRRPSDYDLEHEGNEDDIRFYVRMVERLRPRRVLELACGSGRVTVPLAEAGARLGAQIVGLELAAEMLDEAGRKRRQAPSSLQDALTLVQGDMRTWRSDEPFDLILTPCSSLCHLLTLEDRLVTWQSAHANLSGGGRFVADTAMPDFAVFAESCQTPPRMLVEMDIDTRPGDGRRLIRYKTTRYHAHEQRAEVRFLYDRMEDTESATERYVSDFESHVYFPCEVELLFRHTGFRVEHVYGDYFDRPLRATSRELIVVGAR